MHLFICILLSLLPTVLVWKVLGGMVSFVPSSLMAICLIGTFFATLLSMRWVVPNGFIGLVEFGGKPTGEELPAGHYFRGRLDVGGILGKAGLYIGWSIPTLKRVDEEW